MIERVLKNKLVELTTKYPIVTLVYAPYKHKNPVKSRFYGIFIRFSATYR